jgi:subtilisin family serine protease
MNALLTGSAYSWNTIGADIISCSAGLTPEFINLLTIDTTLCNEELLLAHNEGRNGNGTIMFFSAGNENSPNVLWPANMSRTIAVGASDMCDTRKRPNDCSGENWWGSDYGETLDFVAPGVKIATCDITGNLGYSSNDYALTFNGTSAACPIAAGVGALLLSENPELTANEVRHLLNVTSEKVEPYAYDSLNVDGSWNEEVGHGRINAYEALTQVFNADTSPKHPAQSLTIYPNPNQGLINIKGLNSTSTFVIYDLMGKKQHSGVVTINNPEIQTTNLKPGIYHLNLRNHVIKFVLL